MLREMLQLDIQTSVVWEQYISSLKNEVDNIILWGASPRLLSYLNFLKKNNLLDKVIYIGDNNEQKQGDHYLGFQVLSGVKVAEVIKNSSLRLRIVIVAVHVFEIQQQLCNLGIPLEKIDSRGGFMCFEDDQLGETSINETITQNIDFFEKVYNLLEDEHSKKVYLSILNSKLTLDNSYLVDVSSNSANQYFEPGIIDIEEKEVFCDCGSYTGDTMEFFIDTYDSYRKYIAIEADPKNYAALQEKIIDKKYSEVQTFCSVLWDKKEIVHFNADHTDSSQVNLNGNIETQAETLDDLLKDISITFLKMDIEGAEEKAILGGLDTIKRDKPILAICIYHSLSDLYNLPLLMNNINPDYKFFVRHYTRMYNTETVCYAIPTHRLIQ